MSITARPADVPRSARTAMRVLAASLLFGVALAASAARIGDSTFDDRIRLAQAELQLNGVGVRAVAWLQGYAAGLYLAEPARSAAQVLAVPGPKRLQMKMLVDVEPKEFVKAIDKGMRRNHSPAEHEALKPRIAEFDRLVAAMGTSRKGDVVDLDWLPGRGLVVSRNGAAQGQPIAGEDFYAGVLKIFIGDDPVDKRLKAGLLGPP